MKFCSHCGQTIVRQIPPNDTRERSVCLSCHTIHYDNPRNIVGTIPVWQDKVLLCRRAIEPRRGYWTLPAGFMEIGENAAQGAARETLEEAGVAVQVGELFALINTALGRQVHLFYLAAMPSAAHAAGIESLEVKLFSEAEIPWQDLAFQTSYHALQFFFSDLAQGLFAQDFLSGHFRLHTLDLAQKMN